MSNRAMKPISDFGYVITGKTPPTSSPEDFGGNILFVTPPDFSKDKILRKSDRTVSDLGASKLQKKVLKRDAVMVTCIGDIGNVAMTVRPSITNQQINSIVVDIKKYSPDYIYYLIKNSRRYLVNNAGQTVLAILGKSEFEKIELPVFTQRLYQEKIASVLTTLDSKIELNNRINAELEAMARMLYDYWFVQFDFPDGSGKPYKTSGGKMVWNEELKREIPEGWEVKRIDYYADIIDPHPSHRAPLEVSNGFPFAGIGDIDEYGNIDTNKARVINEEFVLKQERDYTINEYSIGYGRVGTVGKVVKLRKQPFRFALSPTMAIINPKDNKFPSFVYSTVTNPTFFQWVKKYTSGSTRPAIGIQHLRTIPVIRPKGNSEDLLERFERIVESSFKQTDILNKENQKLTELRDWLLPMLMNGQVKVKDTTETELLMAAEPKVKYGK